MFEVHGFPAGFGGHLCFSLFSPEEPGSCDSYHKRHAGNVTFFTKHLNQ